MFIKGLRSHLIAAVAVSTLGVPAAPASEFSVATAFTYQGSLEYRGAPAEGLFDFEFLFFDEAEGGNFLGRVDHLGLPVANGAFATELDFGRDVFSSAVTWLEIHVREAPGGAFTTLGPRQRLAGSRASACTVDGDLLVTGRLGIGASNAATPLDIAFDDEATLSGGGSLKLRDGQNTKSLVLDHDEIQSRSLLGVANKLLINEEGGNVGIGVSSPNTPLDIGPGDDVTTSGGGSLTIRNDSFGGSLAFDGDEIMSRSSFGSPKELLINAEGGNVGIGTSSPQAPLHVAGGTDVSLGGGGELIVGTSSGPNLGIDRNEIMARVGGSASTLTLNSPGGTVAVGGLLQVSGSATVGGLLQVSGSATVGGPLQVSDSATVGGSLGIGYEIVSATGCVTGFGSKTVTCPPGKVVLGGGCHSADPEEELERSFPSANNAWTCQWDTCGVQFGFYEAFAICARIAP